VSDAQVVEVQIGRPLRAPVEVVSRCHLGLPVVVAVPPLLDDGTPFPTRYWLTCPLATKRVGRLESIGGVKRMEKRAEIDPEFARRLEETHRRYASERDALLPPDASPRPTGGVAGAARGVKCLHAHYADHRAGNDNPVGEAVSWWVEPLDCDRPCVLVGTEVRVNPEWREPR
jgi:hypothetical protein